MTDETQASQLLPLLGQFQDVPVLLVGDLMLDRYVWGSVSRISPEAPVPVLKVAREEERLGGAGCVAANLAEFGAKVQLVSVLGEDEPGARVLDMLSGLGVDTAGIVRTADVQTTQKTRLIARTQHMLRLDYDGEALAAETLAALEQAALERLDGVKAVLISDYAKGVLAGDLARAIGREARARGIPVIVDPHPNTPFETYTGVSTLTPNRSETAGAVGVDPQDEATIHEAARLLIERFDLEWATVTLDKDGIYVLRKGEAEGQRYSAKARSVFDVAGAGDMVLSVFGLGVACGADLGRAVQLANVAAGMEVERLGVATVTRAELEHELVDTFGAPPLLRRKIVDRAQLDKLLEHPRRAGKTIVFTNGCFDLLHAGHVHFLQGCRAKGDFLVVGLNTDVSIQGLKGPDRPVLTLEERATVLAGLEAVDLVVPFDEVDIPVSLILQVHPDVLCKGEDYATKLVVGRAEVEAYGGRVELVELLPGMSTTHVIARIESGRSPGNL